MKLTPHHNPLRRILPALFLPAGLLCSVTFNTTVQAHDRYFWKGGSNDFMTWWNGENNAPSNEAPGLTFYTAGGARNAIAQGSGDVVNLNDDYTANYTFDNLVIRGGATMNINGNLDIATAPTNLNLASGGTYNHNAYTVQAKALTGGGGTYNLNSGGALVLTNGLAASDAAYNFNFGTGGNGENVSLTANNVQIDNANDVVFTVGSGSNLTLTGSGSNFADGFAVNGGTLQLGNGGAGGSIDTSYALDLANGGKLIVNRTDTVTQGTDFSTAAITGAGTIAHHGTGTLILDRANSLGAGTTHIGDLAGSDSATRVLEIRDNSSLGSGQITFYKGGTLDLGADALTVSNFIFNGNYSSGTKTIKLDSDEAGHTGTIAGAMIIQNQTAGSFEVEVGAADTLTMSGTIGNYAAGGAGITKTGDGTLILSGTNTYKGATTVNAGVLKLSGGSAIDDIRDVVVGIDGALDLNDSNETINRLTGSGTVDNTAAGTATLIVGSNGNDATFDGTITDTGAALKFRKTGSGTQTLTAASSYQGGTDIYEGTIVANDSAALSTGQIYMGVTNGVTQTLEIGAGGLDIANTFFLQNSNSTHEIKFDVDGSNASTLSGNMTNQVDYAGEWDVIVGADDTLTLSGNLSSGSNGNSGLDKEGAGTLVLSGSNSYKGQTRVNNGTLSLATGYEHSLAGAYIVEGGTLKIAHGVDISTHAMTISLGGVISPGNSPGTAITGDQTWEDGGSYLWEINDMAGGEGSDPGWDWLDIQGTLDISATFNILITSLDLSNNAGLADGFDTTGLSYLDPYASFTIATATDGVTGFDASAFNLNDSAFLNSKVGWSIENIGNDIVLNAFFVPEPSSTALLGLGGLALMLRRKRSAA